MCIRDRQILPVRLSRADSRPCATDEGRLSKWYDMIWYDMIGGRPSTCRHMAWRHLCLAIFNFYSASKFQAWSSGYCANSTVLQWPAQHCVKWWRLQSQLHLINHQQTGKGPESWSATCKKHGRYIDVVKRPPSLLLLLPVLTRRIYLPVPWSTAII